MAANKVNLGTGLTDPGATLGVSTIPLNPPLCPFAGQVTLQGPNDPALETHQYRIKATNAGTYVVPSAYGEGMYDRSLKAPSAGGSMVVEKR